MSDNQAVYGVVMADSGGIIRHWSAGAEELLGYAAREAQGRSLDLIVPPAYRNRHWQGFRQAMTSAVCENDREAFNLPINCKGNVARIFPTRFVFLQDPFGWAVGALVIFSAPDGSEQPFGPVIQAHI